MLTSNSSILALDVGGKRIGVASASAIARIASPLTTLEHTSSVVEDIKALIKKHDVAMLVVGMPRGLDGQRTAQTEAVQQFFLDIQPKVEVPMYWQDEAVTSRKAKEELNNRGRSYRKEDIDALAATYILEDFLGEHPEVKI